MIITRSPYRVSILGGSTDYNEYIEKYHRGMCIGFTINKYSYIAVQPLQDHSRIIYSEIERVADNRCIQHKAIKAALKQMCMIDDYVEITHLSDITANAGLGTSSAMMAALITALAELSVEIVDKETLIKYAAQAEQSYSNVGWQDVALSVYGGISKLEFTKSLLGVEVAHTPYQYYQIQEQLEQQGLLFYTGITRNASDIIGSYKTELTSYKVEQIYQLAVKGDKILNGDYFDIYALGELICESWNIKKSLSPNIVTPRIAELEYELTEAGAWSFKLLGAGGGGTVFCIPAAPRLRQDIIDKAESMGCQHIPFSITWKGTEVISK